MTVSRLLNLPITLVTRVTGPDDAWGSPTYTDVEVETVCYFRQTETDDADVGGEIVTVTYDVFLPPDTAITEYDAAVLNAEQYEVIGQPAPEYNARSGQVNHLRMRVRKAAP